MRAIVVPAYGSPDVLTLQEDAAPPMPGPGEVAIDVRYVGVSFADVMFRRGQFPIGTPHIPGMEVSGVVAACGSGVDHVLSGEPAVALTLGGGGLAERVVTKADWTVGLRGATAMPLRLAAAVPCNALTAQGVLGRAARMTPGESLLVTAPVGGLGQFIHQLAELRGASAVIAVTDDPAKQREALDRGYTHAFATADVVDDVAAATAGRGVDIVVDSVGGELRRRAMDLLAANGRHVVIGDASDDDLGFTGNQVWASNRSVCGFNLGAWAHDDPPSVRRDLSSLLESVASGGIDVVHDVVSWSRVVDVHERLESRSSRTKWVLAVSEPEAERQTEEESR